MANTTISPNMGMPVPVVSVDPGPDWATNIDACLSILDSHNHASGQGVQITPSGLNINSDLSFQNNNATNARSVRFYPQSAPLALGTDIGCLYESGVDLYYNDGNGNQIRITQGGSVTGSSGTITGLPSGTASAAYSAGTFTFQSATSTPAAMNIGPVTIGNQTAGSKNITIAPNSGIAANYNLTLPAALPAAANYMTLDNTGAVSYNTSGNTGSGAVVLATSPTITTPSLSSPSMSSPTVSSGALTVSSSGITFTSGTLADYVDGTWTISFSSLSNMSSITEVNARYQRIGNWVYCRMALTFTSTSGIASANFSLPINPNNNFNTADPSQFFQFAYPGTNSGNGSPLVLISMINGQKLAQFSTNFANPVTGYTAPYGYAFMYSINN